MHLPNNAWYNQHNIYIFKVVFYNNYFFFCNSPQKLLSIPRWNVACFVRKNSIGIKFNVYHLDIWDPIQERQKTFFYKVNAFAWLKQLDFHRLCSWSKDTDTEFLYIYMYKLLLNRSKCYEISWKVTLSHFSCPYDT